MKKTLIIVLALTLVIAGVAAATVVSSKHDMRSTVTVSGRTITSSGSATTQVCVFCHHPHRGAAAGITSVLLWNISDAAQTYPTYSSPTANATNINGSNVANSTSLLCMGCHDGATGTNAFIKGAIDGTLGSMPDLSAAGRLANLGATLADDHPIEFDYPTADGAGMPDIQKASGGQVVGGINNQGYPLFAGTMQCSTCHNVHDGQSPDIQFMRGTVANSVICIDCHTAK